jgi:TPR repeat protein
MECADDVSFSRFVMPCCRPSAALAFRCRLAKDAAEAVKWYHKAAEQGFAYAQGNLGACYLYGNGVAKDVVIAYMWADLAAVSSVENARRNARGNAGRLREHLEKRMTAEQIAEAQRMSKKWKPRPHQAE